MTGTERDTLVLSSSYDELERIEPWLKELQERLDFHNDEFARIMLALSEAVTNAIVHGNREDPGKSVTVRSAMEDGRLRLSVQDEGEGFEPGKLPDPLQEENLLKEGGRGVYLIEQYCDAVNYSRGGTRITMDFDLD
ncbi:MAG: ATP-binding protein [Balneolaceae bacterium]|nr:ATP-binding protein [Balneolaceae bacterium]